MTKKTKGISLLFLAGALIAVIFLAMSLSNLELRSGTRFPSEGNAEDAIQAPAFFPSVKSYSSPVLQGILALIFLVVIIYVSIRIIVLLGRKEVFQVALAIMILFALVYLISLPVFAPPAPSQGGDFDLKTPLPINYPVVPLGEPPQGLIWFVIIGVVVGVSFPFINMAKDQLKQNKADEKILEEAEHAINALHSGEELRNVILRCYMQMTHALYEEQGIERNHTMTVREFEDLLALRGFPNAPVKQITALFEKVRYGEELMSKEDEGIAVESLNEIVRFCRRDGMG